VQDDTNLDGSFKALLMRVQNYVKVIPEADLTRVVGYSGDIKIVTQNIAPNYVFEDIDY
jgi:hypothetical protein